MKIKYLVDIEARDITISQVIRDIYTAIKKISKSLRFMLAAPAKKEQGN